MTGSIKALPQPRRGDVNCDGAVDVSDAVLLARLIVADSRAKITDAGRRSADCNHDGFVTADASASGLGCGIYVCDGNVYVGYTTNKEAVEIAIIPEESLK